LKVGQLCERHILLSIARWQVPVEESKDATAMRFWLQYEEQSDQGPSKQLKDCPRTACPSAVQIIEHETTLVDALLSEQEEARYCHV